MRAVLIAWLLCCGAGWLGVCAAVPSEKFKLLAYDQSPYTQADADGTPKGAAVEMVQEIFARLRVMPQLHIYPLARSLALFEHGYASGIFTMKKTPELERQYAFSDRPLFKQEMVLFVRKDMPIEFSGDLRTLSGRSVGLVRGAAYGQVVDAAVGSRVFSRLDYASHDEWSFRKLIVGRVDAVITGRQTGLAMLKKLHATASLRIVGPPLAITESYIMFDRRAIDAGFLRRFNAAMALVQKDGSASRIKAKYGLQ
ncbi:transporter substrate-binding domain-containing protein [Duganella sp. FT134W]|uniref:Transporter substrate-binding domain-containing protein n=1 Tax=Duganella margarita TaxID=2692170 RepID=A0A7X4H0S6_9BURK|nr:transporter substrate-binding domain-containing protein [Duganella margarita]MYM72089.1 transporter substrate-binding domain-containing protein [Duganella margarita]